jgi:hypothetical protein
MKVNTTIIGLLFVPGSVVIALVKSDDQKSDLKVPYVTLLTNDWFGRDQTSSFVNEVCQRGYFKSDYQKALRGEKFSGESGVNRQNIASRDSGRNASQTATFFVPFADPY